MWVLLFLIIIFTPSMIFSQNTSRTFVEGKIFIPADSENLEYFRVEFVLSIDDIKYGGEKFFGGKCVSTEKWLFWNKGEEFVCFGRIVINDIDSLILNFLHETDHNPQSSISFSFAATVWLQKKNEDKNEKVFYFREKAIIGEVEGFFILNFPPKTIFDLIIPPSKRFKFENSLN
jgi:hypothetical protein